MYIIYIVILYQFRLQGPSRTYMTTFFPYIPVGYVASTLMLSLCMNPYATSFSSSPPHGIYSHSIMFSQRTFQGKILLLNMSKYHSLQLQLH
jgi:hypothetical protein